MINKKKFSITIGAFISLLMLLPHAFAWSSDYASWQYRMPITVTEQSGNDLTDYQVGIIVDTQSLISQGKMNSDCSDMRFTYENASGEYAIPYWIESGCNSNETKVWIKVPSIPASSSVTIFMYYGNPSATSESNGTAVFDFFDDFENVIGSWWTTTTNVVIDTTFYYHGSASVKVIDQDASSYYIERINSKLGTNNVNYLAFSIAVSESTNYPPSGNWRHYVYDSSGTSPTTGSLVSFEATTTNLYYDKGGTYETILVSGISTNTFYRVEFVFNFTTNTVKIWVNGTYKGEFYYENSITEITKILHTTGPVVYNDAWLDYEIERKYVNPEPTVSFGSEEQQTGNLAPQITIYSPQSTTYWTTQIYANFSVYDDNSTAFWVKAWIDGILIYNNSNYVNNTFVSLNLNSYIDDGSNNFTIWSNDTDIDSPQVSTQTVIFTLDLYDFSLTLSNYTVFNNTKYAENIVIDYSARCGFIGNNISIKIFANNSEIKTQTITCDNSTYSFTDVYKHDSETLTTIKGVLYDVYNNEKLQENDTYQTDLKQPIINVSTTLHTGFFDYIPTENASYSVYDSVSPYLICDYYFGNVNGTENISTSEYSEERIKTYQLAHGNNTLRVVCKDIVNHTTTQTLTKEVFRFEIKPIDEETGIYDTDLWVDSTTGNMSLMRFVAVDKNMNESFIYEDINQTLYLVLLPSKSWLLRFEQEFTAQVISSVFDLEYSPATIYVCVAQDKPYIYQTAYASVPLDGAFAITRSETGCLRAISTTQIIENGYGFKFYTKAGQYALWYIPETRNYNSKTLLASFSGDAQTVLDLERALLLIQEVSEIPIPEYHVLLISKVQNQNATLIRYLSNQLLTKFQINLTKYGESTPFFTQTLYDVQSVRLQLLWNNYNLKDTDIIYVSYSATLQDGRTISGKIRTTPTGREIWFLWWQACMILMIPLVLTFWRNLSPKNILPGMLVFILLAIFIIPHAEINIWVQAFGILAVFALITSILIISKVL